MTNPSAAGENCPLRAEEVVSELLEVAVRLARSEALDEILQVATNGVCRALRAERASLFFCNPEGRELYTRVVTELEIQEIRHTYGQGITGWVAEHGQLQCINDVQRDDRWDRSVDRLTGFQTRNMLVAPILSPEDRRVLGVLQVLNKPGGFTPFDERVVMGFASHLALALQRQKWEQEAQAAQRLRQQLEMGRQIQSDLFPREWPHLAGYQVAAWWEPAEYVSGDYYDWLRASDGRWFFAIGDVSGHGLAAALLMSSLRAMVHVLTHTVSQPARILEVLRSALAADLGQQRFITFLCLALDPQTHVIQVANAGHAPGFLYRRETGQIEILPPMATPIGFPAWGESRAPGIWRLAPGDMLVLGTDGTFEARNSAGELFGMQRLQLLVQQHGHRDAEQVLHVVRESLHQHQQGVAPADDCTLVLIRRQV
ncbi:MAG: hypothetical protein KatS3mg114_0291 [Planctomycetaceae bacterium]|nr:MAG: hypothetical protein KatS3mg114_0291 [Planctomycetaceae bacterium]